MLKRKKPPFQVVFSKDGCQDETMLLEQDRATGKGVAGNILVLRLGAGGVIGIGVDAMTGAGYDIKPNPLIANLNCD